MVMGECQGSITNREAGCFSEFLAVYDKSSLIADSVQGGSLVSHLPSDIVSKYLHVGFCRFSNALEQLKTHEADEKTRKQAEEMADGFLRLGEITRREWGRYGCVPRRDFRRTSLIVRSVFKRGAFDGKPRTSAFQGRVDPSVYRRLVLDRVRDAVRDSLVWLRDETRRIERLANGCRGNDIM